MTETVRDDVELVANAIGGFFCASDRHKGEHFLAARAAINALRQQATDRESIRGEMREECAKVADKFAAQPSDRLPTERERRWARATVAAAENIAAAIRSIPTGGDNAR